MANRYFTQFMYSLHKMPVLIDCNVVIGSAGSVSNLKGPGVKSVTKLDTGIYQVQLEDNYHRLYTAGVGFVAPVTGANIDDGSFVAGTVYIITVVGTTDWQAAGLPAGLTPKPGQVFVAANVGGSGTGKVKAVGTSGIQSAEVVGNTNLMLNPVGSANQGGFVTVQCLDKDGALANPAAGSVMGISMMLSNSTVMTAGE